MLVEKCTDEFDDLRAAHAIVAAAARCAVVLRNGIGAVQRVIQTAPASVGGIERVADVVDRYHELWPGHLGDLGIDLRGVDGKRIASGVQVANLLQELPVLRSIEIWAGVGAVPGIDLCLQLIATLQ